MSTRLKSTKSAADLGARRREEILPVASKVFARDGYRNTDVQEIADLLGIGKGTIYRAFPTKEDLFLACVDDGMQRLSDRMQEYSMQCESQGLDLLARFETCIYEFLAFFESNEDLVELLMQERSEFRDRPTHSYHRHQIQNRERFANNMTKAIADGLIRHLPVEDVIGVINDTIYGAIFTHYFSKKKMHLASTAKLITDVLINGIISDSKRQSRVAPATKELTSEHGNQNGN